MSGKAAWLRPTLIAFAMVAALLLLIAAPSIAALNYPDPDDVLRMVQVRDLLAGQGWFDLRQYRLDAPNGGVPMHWSRLVDLPLAAMITLLAPLTGPAAAEIVTAVIVPLLTLGCAVLLVGRQAARLCGIETVTYACLALAMSAPVLSQMLPLRIDHHGWQIVMALLTLTAIMSSDARRGGWVAGASMAVWLSISLEGLPMAAAFSGVLAMRWVREREAKTWFVTGMSSLAGASVLLFIATRGVGDLAFHCDALSPVHLAAFVWAAAGSLLLSRLDPRSPSGRLIGLAAIAAGGAAILAMLEPRCAAGGFAGMDPLVESFWYRGIAEGQPLWQQSAGVWLQSLAPPIIGLLGLGGLWRQSASSSKRRVWAEYALVLGTALVVSLFVTRAGAVAGALAAVPFGWRLRRWLEHLREAGRWTRAGTGLGLVVLAALVALPGTGDVSGATTPLGPVIARPAGPCAVAEAGETLSSLSPGEILAPMDIGPQLLLETPHTVIASSHHRGEAGMRFAIDLFLGRPDAARGALAARGTTYLALCPDINEAVRFRRAAPDGLLAQLAEGQSFDWLQPVPMPAASGLKLWRIAP